VRYLDALAGTDKLELHDRLVWSGVACQLLARRDTVPVLLSHHFENAHNFLTLETFYLGMPVVHNADVLRSARAWSGGCARSGGAPGRTRRCGRSASFGAPAHNHASSRPSRARRRHRPQSRRAPQRSRAPYVTNRDDRRALLDALDFVWDALDDDWQPLASLEALERGAAPRFERGVCARSVYPRCGS
jgi:hypothetical protein